MTTYLTMCVCGENQRAAESGSENFFEPHTNSQTGAPCTGMPMNRSLIAHAWLVAQVQADLDAAREATPGPWEVFTNTDDQTFVVYVGAPEGKAVTIEVNSHDGDYTTALMRQPIDGQHIATWNPARVIAECEAKLRRLQRHAPVNFPDPSHAGYWVCGYWVCGVCWSDNMNFMWPCPEILDDAAPYQNHADLPGQLNLGG